MFIDQVTISVQAGDGGNGAVTFHREKYVPAGGPDGGDGGRGGNIIFRVDEGSNTLLAFRYHRKFEAGRGEDGKGDKMHGKNGQDVVILVPPGTLLRDPESKKILFDMSRDREFVAAKGGRGGWGNRHFATPTRQIPRFAKSGTKGEEKNVLLELKMIADVGLIGFPNVGKSSLLSRISKARPKIADYHFTTLSPNLGVVEVGEGRGFVCADIPGLIEGASEGLGLGHDFLRHTDRCRLLLHVIDLSGSEGRDPVDDIAVIDRELARYSPELATHPQIIVANKSDALDADSDAWERVQAKAKELGRPVIRVSAATGEGLADLVRLAATELEKLPPVKEYEPEITAETEAARKALEAADEKQTFVRRENGIYTVEGKWLENFMNQLNLNDYDQLNRFQQVLEKNGVIAQLREAGVRDGDTVEIYGFSFDFYY
ncbi:MAG: GTPase ObgE [Clostridia bacterium]|nr:GTPase ObgE [Clostridia bacterium]